MWEQTQLIIQTIQLAAVLAIFVLHSITFAEYFRLKRRTTRVISLLRTKMDCDDLIDQLLEEDEGDRPAKSVPAAPNTTPLPPAAASEARTKNDPTGGNRGWRHGPKIYRKPTNPRTN